MTQPLVTGTLLKCSMGLAPAVFASTPLPGLPLVNGALPAATIVQFLPMVNIPPFGMCQSMANPQVIAATAAAMGALTPMPCVPNVVAPWMPPAVSTLALGQPLATIGSKCMCMWGGMIEASPTIPGSLDVT